MDWIVNYLQANIVLVLFLIIGLGHLVGKLKIGSIGLGPITGILIVGLLIGLLHLEVPGIVKGLSFTLYLFVLGNMVGPGLVHMLTSRSAFTYLALSLATAVFMAVSIFFVAKFFDLNSITAGGLAAGAMTTSAILAAAQGMISSGGITLPEGLDVNSASNMLSGAYALTYLYGTFGLIVLVKIAPMLTGKDLAAEAAKLDGGADSKIEMVNRNAAIRAWTVSEPDYIGKTVADVEAKAATYEAEQGIPTLIEKVVRNGELLEVNPDLVLQAGDVVAVWATPGMLVLGDKVFGEEVTDAKVLSVKLDSAELVVTNKEIVDKPLGEFVRECGRGVTVDRLVRRGQDLPVRADITLIAGDVIFASGPVRQLEAFAEQVGYVVRDQLKTNLVTLGIFLAVFGVLGTITVTAFGVTITVLGGAAMGAMVGGALLGWLRSRSPMWGTVSAPAADALTSIGIGVFIAAVGVGAGGSIVQLLQGDGLKLIGAGAIVTTFCTMATFFFAVYVLRMNVWMAAGGTCGSMTGVAIDEVCKDAKSSAPALAYALPGAINNLFFTIVALILMAIL